MKILSIIFILVFGFTAFGQSKTVKWSASNSNKCCDSYAEKNDLWTTYQDKNVSWSIIIEANEFQRDDTELHFTAIIKNLSANRLTVTPSTFVLKTTSPRNKTYAAVNPEELVKRKRDQTKARELYSEISLPNQTLSINEHVLGNIYFDKRKMKTPKGYILTFTLGDTTYEIPFGTERK